MGRLLAERGALVLTGGLGARRTDLPVVCLNGWLVLAADGAQLPLETAQSPAGAVQRLFELIEAHSIARGGKMDG